MPNTKKNHGHETDTNRKGAASDDKSKAMPEKGRNESSKNEGGSRDNNKK